MKKIFLISLIFLNTISFSNSLEQEHAISSAKLTEIESEKESEIILHLVESIDGMKWFNFIETTSDEIQSLHFIVYNLKDTDCDRTFEAKQEEGEHILTVIASGCFKCGPHKREMWEVTLDFQGKKRNFVGYPQKRKQ